MKRRNYAFIDRRGGNNKVLSDFIYILKKLKSNKGRVGRVKKIANDAQFI